MDIKQKIKNWLGIKEVDENELEKRISKELDSKLDKAMSLIHKFECYECHKELSSYFGGAYRDFKGRNFCSHECIDRSKEAGT